LAAPARTLVAENYYTGNTNAAGTELDLADGWGGADNIEEFPQSDIVSQIEVIPATGRIVVRFAGGVGPQDFELTYVPVATLESGDNAGNVAALGLDTEGAISWQCGINSTNLNLVPSNCRNAIADLPDLSAND
jgi:hypothetical protein